jgi:2-dehydro-3-deoxyphosphogluconate aldolase/(4S)-4-hydroxy-2-oxoglutarate aldolase
MASKITQLLLDYPLVPVFYNADSAIAQAVAQACYAGGVRVFEFTNRGKEALNVFKTLVPFIKKKCPGMAIGIGTIYTAEEAESFIAAGAQFIVQPCTTAAVGAVSSAHHIPWIPGVMTPTEIQQALMLGAEAVKIFPGNVVGSGYVKSLRGPMPDIKIMVTGGVEPTPESLKEWFGAGANAVGLGSQLFKNLDDLSLVENTLADLFKFIQP